jgi:hypothetical protein
MLNNSKEMEARKEMRVNFEVDIQEVSATSLAEFTERVEKLMEDWEGGKCVISAIVTRMRTQEIVGEVNVPSVQLKEEATKPARWGVRDPNSVRWRSDREMEKYKQ